MADAKDLCELADVTVPPEKHTPGPWKIEPRHIEGLFVSGADNIHSIVAQIRVYPDAPDESASNASLIAMAPALLESHTRLLEALKEVRVWLLDKGPITDDGIWHPHFVKANNAVHAALAPAEKLAVKP
jgi:hypothetical protein